MTHLKLLSSLNNYPADQQKPCPHPRPVTHVLLNLCAYMESCFLARSSIFFLQHSITSSQLYLLRLVIVFVWYKEYLDFISLPRFLILNIGVLHKLNYKLLFSFKSHVCIIAKFSLSTTHRHTKHES